MLWRRRRRADPYKTHALEYDLGMRDDPPPMTTPPTDEPGAIIWYKPSSLDRADAVLKEAYTAGLDPRRFYNAN